MIKKNDEFIVDIIDYGADGEGIAKIDGYTIFIIDALKGEKCEIHITKVLKSYAYAKVVKVISNSIYRKEPDCSTYKRCGGCNLRHISYEETLKIKKEKIQNLADKTFGKEKIKIDETIGMENPFHYRNKAIYPVNQKKEVGIYANRSHEIIPINKCFIQTELSQKIAKYIIDNWNESIYNEETQKGLLRNIMVREGFGTHEVMLVLVQTKEKNVFEKENSNLSIEKLINEFPMIKTIIINVNKENTNVVLSRDNIIVYGKGYITDKLGGYTFKISANSFYQINPVQTEKIYNLAIKKAELKNEDIVCDLYCGIGTIGIFAAKYVSKVYGIEIVEEAIKDAKENAKINGISNADFLVGDVENVFEELLKKGTKPNTVFVDPPRKGLDKNTIENLKKLKLEKIVYVSCNPATLVRDLKELNSVYDINSVTPIDNFCFTSHVEVVTLLELKEELKNTIV